MVLGVAAAMAVGCGFTEVPLEAIEENEAPDGEVPGGGSGDTPGDTPIDEPIIVSAVIAPAEDFKVQPGATFTLDGSASTGATLEWTTSGDCPVIDTPTAATVTLIAPSNEGSCEFTLTVTEEGESSEVSVSVETVAIGLVVSPTAPCTNRTPSAAQAGDGTPILPWCTIGRALAVAETFSGERVIRIDGGFSYDEDVALSDGIVLDGSFVRDNRAGVAPATILGQVSLVGGGALRNLSILGNPCSGAEPDCVVVRASGGEVGITDTDIGCSDAIRPFRNGTNYFALWVDNGAELTLSSSRLCGARSADYSAALLLDGRAEAISGTLTDVTLVLGEGTDAFGVRTLNTTGMNVTGLRVQPNGLPTRAVGWRDGVPAGDDTYFECESGESFCDASQTLTVSDYQVSVTAGIALGLELIGTEFSTFEPSPDASQVVAVGQTSAIGIATFSVNDLRFRRGRDDLLAELALDASSAGRTVGFADRALGPTPSRGLVLSHFNAMVIADASSSSLEGLVLSGTEAAVVSGGQLRLSGSDGSNLDSAAGVQLADTGGAQFIDVKITGDIHSAMESFGFRDGRIAGGVAVGGSTGLVLDAVNVDMILAGTAHCVQFLGTFGRDGGPMRNNTFACSPPRGSRPYTLLSMIATQRITIQDSTFRANPALIHGGALRVTAVVDGYAPSAGAAAFDEVPRPDASIEASTFTAPGSNGFEFFRNTISIDEAASYGHGILFADGPGSAPNIFENNVITLPVAGTAFQAVNTRFRLVHNTLIFEENLSGRPPAVIVSNGPEPGPEQRIANNLVVVEVVEEDNNPVVFEFRSPELPEDLHHNILITPVGEPDLVCHQDEIFTVLEWEAADKPDGHVGNRTDAATVDMSVPCTSIGQVPEFSDAVLSTDFQENPRADRTGEPGMVDPGAYSADTNACE